MTAIKRKYRQRTELQPLSWHLGYFSSSKTILVLTLLLLLAAPLQASSSLHYSDNQSDFIPLTIKTQYKIPDVIATVGKLFVFQIPANAYPKDISTIKVIQ